MAASMRLVMGLAVVLAISSPVHLESGEFVELPQDATVCKQRRDSCLALLTNECCRQQMFCRCQAQLCRAYNTQKKQEGEGLFSTCSKDYVEDKCREFANNCPGYDKDSFTANCPGQSLNQLIDMQGLTCPLTDNQQRAASKVAPGGSTAGGVSSAVLGSVGGVCALVVIVIIGIIIYCCCCRKKKSKKDARRGSSHSVGKGARKGSRQGSRQDQNLPRKGSSRKGSKQALLAGSSRGALASNQNVSSSRGGGSSNQIPSSVNEQPGGSSSLEAPIKDSFASRQP